METNLNIKSESMLNKLNFKSMKKIILGLIATVLVSVSSFGQISISQEDAKKIAIEHNKYLENLFLKNPKNIDDVNQYFKSIKIEGLDNNIRDLFVQHIDFDSNYNLIKKHASDKEVIKIIDNCNLIIKNNTDVKETNKKLDSQIIVAQEKLRGFDLSIIYVYIEVLKKSNEFWTENYNNNKSTYRINPNLSKGEKVLAADAAGAAGSLIGGALFAAGTGPIAPLTFFGAVGFGAAWSSGCAALGM